MTLAVTSKNNWGVGALSFTGKPHDGHTLTKQLMQTRSMIGENARIKNVFVDRGYSGHQHQGHEYLVAAHAALLLNQLCDKRIYQWIESGDPKDLTQLRKKWKRNEGRLSPMALRFG